MPAATTPKLPTICLLDGTVGELEIVEAKDRTVGGLFARTRNLDSPQTLSDALGYRIFHVFPPGAWQKTIRQHHEQQNLVVGAWDHDDPLGPIVELSEESDGLRAVIRVLGGTLNDQRWAWIEGGAAKQASPQFDPGKVRLVELGSRESDETAPVIVHDEVLRLKELSVCMLGHDPLTPVQSLSDPGGTFAVYSEAAQHLMRLLAGGDVQSAGEIENQATRLRDQAQNSGGALLGVDPKLYIDLTQSLTALNDDLEGGLRA